LKDRVLSAIDLVDVIGERLALTRKGKDYVALCPFHDDHKPSLSVSQSKQIFKCWACGAGGDAIKFVQMFHRVDFREALSMLAERAGVQIGAAGSSDEAGAREREQLRQVLAWAAKHFQRNLRETPGGRKATEYARGRGFSDEDIERFGLGYAASAGEDWTDLLAAAGRSKLSAELLEQVGLVARSKQGRHYDRFRDRLMFPIADPQGRVVGFGGRTLCGDDAKYLNSPETPLFNKSRILFGLDMARRAIETQREAIVVEGYTDALLLGSRGVDNVVAPLGTALTDAQVQLLRRSADRFVMCFDGDEAGMNAADRAVEIALRQRVDVRVAVMPEGEDPADCVIRRGADGFKSLLQLTVDALEFKWKRASQSLRTGDAGDRRDAIEAFLQFVARTTGAGGIGLLDQGLLVSRLAEVLSLPAGSIYELLNKARASTRRQASSKPPDTSSLSAYDAAVRRLPAGLVSAMEELFGHALTSPESFAPSQSALAAGAGQCDTWRRLHALLERQFEATGRVDRAAILADCDDADVCDLVSRAHERVASVSSIEESSEIAAQRVMSELAAMRVRAARERLRDPDGKEPRVFGSVLTAGNERSGWDSPGVSWSSLSRSN